MYKRQRLWRVLKHWTIINNIAYISQVVKLTLLLIDSQPVSYTHLDVYKRQVERRLGESVEEIEKQMAILSTEINVEILEVRKEGENTNLKLIQTELDLHQRINEVKQTHDTQLNTITQEQTRMKAAQSTLKDKCEEVAGKVDAIKQQVNDDKTQSTCLLYTSRCV